MAWTAPRTWVAGETVTSAIMNLHVRDNMNVLKVRIDDDGNLIDVLNVEFSEVSDKATSGTGETDAHTFTVPAETLTIGDSISVECHYVSDGNGNNKTVKFYANALTITVTATTAAGDFRCHFRIWRTASGTAYITAYRLLSGGSGNVTIITSVSGAVDWTADVVVKTTVQNATSGTLTEKLMHAVHEA